MRPPCAPARPRLRRHRLLWGSTWLVIGSGSPPAAAPLRGHADGDRRGAPRAVRAVAVPGASSSGPARARVARRPLPDRGALRAHFVVQQWVPSGPLGGVLRDVPGLDRAPRAAVPPRRAAHAREARLGGDWRRRDAVLEAPHLAILDGSGRLALGSALIIPASIVACSRTCCPAGPPAMSPLAMTAGQTSVGSIVLLVAALLLEHGRPARTRLRAGRARLPRGLRHRAHLHRALLARSACPGLRDWGAAAPRHDRGGDARRGRAREPIGWHLAVGGGMMLAAAGLASGRTAVLTQGDGENWREPRASPSIPQGVSRED